MFENVSNNKTMILGAYKKLKSYYYYDKSALYNKMRIAMWEHSIEDMSHRIDDLANFMQSLEGNIDNDYLSMLLKRIGLIPMPKSFSEEPNKEDVLQNVVSNDRKLTKINFYIKAPVELLILDTIWTLMIIKIAYEQCCMPSFVCANRIKAKQVFNDNYDLFAGIDFESNRLFYPYFRQYSSWRDRAFENIRTRYESHQDTILISLDIKNYFYSVIFDFDQLGKYLKDDSRLKSIQCLTDIIKNVHISYTAEMQKFRGNIPADCKKGQSALPIGLMSSSVLANLYLKEFDDAVCQKLNPTYYGRYVDDIILVVDKTTEMDISRDYIIEKLLVKTDIIETRKDSYHILKPNGDLWLQKEKIRCIYFDHTQPDAMIKLLCEASNLKPSMSDGFFMPEINLSEKTFDECAYSIGQNNGTLKIRNFLFATNNYQASLFLNDLIRASKNVNVAEKQHREYMEQQLEQILRFYSFQQAIEFRSAWINVFCLTLVNERYDYFLKFYYHTYCAIDALSSDSVQGIAAGKLEYILNELKSALHEQLSIAASIAIAPHSITFVERALRSVNSCEVYETIWADFDLIFSNAKDIRNANMYNNHMLAFPLINYFNNNNNDISLVKIDPSELKMLISSKELDENKIVLTPRFIHLDELYLWYFLASYESGGNPFIGKIKEINKRFSKINCISYEIENVSEFDSQINAQEHFQNICIADDIKRTIIKTAIASIYIDEKDDVIPVLENSNFNLCPERKSELYRMLNEAKQKGAQIIIFPEFFMPIQWLEEILFFSRKNRIAIVSGLRYMTNDKQAYNYVAILQPFSSERFKYSIPLFREKNYYAPAEMVELARKKLVCKNPTIKSTQLIEWNGLKYSNLMCYELTNIEYRYALRGSIDLLIVPELNRDTSYFSNMVESTTRDLHTFVIQVNTAKYGDSRITGPYNSLFKDIIKIKGGEDNLILTGSLNIEEIEKNRKSYSNKIQERINKAFNGELEDEKTAIRKPKDPVAGFSKEVPK